MVEQWMKWHMNSFIYRVGWLWSHEQGGCDIEGEAEK